jgi:hypothetical protein
MQAGGGSVGWFVEKSIFFELEKKLNKWHNKRHVV